MAVVLAVLAAAGVASAAQQLSAGFGWNHGRDKLHSHSFKVVANAPVPVRPGSAQELDLRLVNPHPYSLRITKLTVDVKVDPTHAKLGCDGRRDFRSIRMPPTSYPIRLRPRRTATLRQLRVAVLPRLAMLNTARNQDACKGAKLTLKFGGRARRWSTGAAR